MTDLRAFTMARVGLDRAGSSLATNEVLAFQLAHARARDAVHHQLDAAGLRREFDARGWPSILLQSAAGDRSTYLRRPDLGRSLNEDSRLALIPHKIVQDLAIVIADGLSALAVERHTCPLLALLLPQLASASWSRAPLLVVKQGRVAIGDEIGQLLGVRLVLMLLGERPGLSSPDSLGAYLTWEPRPGRTDAERNCISNIRPEGLSHEAASQRIFWLLSEARQRRLTGTVLKEEAPRFVID